MKRNVNFGLGLLIAVLLLTPNVSFGADSEEEEFNKIAKILEESTHIPEIEAATQALVKLETIAPDAKVEVLLRALRRELEDPITLRGVCSFVKRHYRSAFVAIGNPAIPFLRKYLQDEDEEFRQEIAIILGWMKDREVLPLLMDMAINTERWRIRIKSVMALGEIGDKEAVPFLIDRLKAEEWRMRERAAHALREIGDKRAIPALKEALKDEFYKRGFRLPEDLPEHLEYRRISYPVRFAAYFALKRMGVKVERIEHDYIVIEE